MRSLVSLLLVCSCYLSTFAQTNSEANAYYQMIRTEQENIGREIYFYKQRVSELNLKILTFQVKKSIALIDSMPAYNNEVRYKSAASELFNYFLSVCQNQYVQLLKLVEDPDIDNKEYRSKVQALFKDISAKEKPYDVKFNAAEDAFILKYNIKTQ